MSKRIIFTVSLTLLGGFYFTILSQVYNLTGKILEQESHTPVPGVYINITNSENTKEIYSVVTDINGVFSITKLKSNVKYNLKASLIGYNDLDMQLEIADKPVDLGLLYMTVKTHAIDEVVVKSLLPSAVQKGDTVEMNADAFKTLPSATAEALVSKMPGVTVEDGVIKAQGEEVKKVLVDGKDFFGEDPSVALKNLPAEIIDKIQIFDKLSEQAQFTGFDDGTSEKAINIITKKEKRNGQFGQLYIGGNFKDRYIAGGNINYFNNQRRISVIGLFNNINQENFSQQDVLGLSSIDINGKHDGGFVIGQQKGINNTRSIGTNYSDSWGKKVLFTGSYFLNAIKNNTDMVTLKDKFLSPRTDHFSSQKDTSTSDKYVHRINMRLEYDIDSMNTLISVPKLTFQTNNSNKFFSKITSKVPGVYVIAKDTFVSSENLRSKSDVNGYNLENELTFRHKFNKERRTISIAITTAANNKDPHNNQLGYYRKTLRDSSSMNEFTDGNTNSYKISSNIDYIEPLSKKSMLHFDLNNAYTNGNKEREVFDIDNNYQILDHVDSLSGLYQSNYFNNHAGVSYRIKSKKLKLSVGAEYQEAYLAGPSSLHNNKTFENILPNFLLNFKRSRSNLKILYKTSTDAPSISQLFNIMDNTDRPNFSIGNIYLKQEYCHNLTFNYSFANPEKSINYTLYLAGEYDHNYLGLQTITAENDTFLQNINFTLLRHEELTRPVNLDHSENVRTVFNFNFPITLILCKLNLTTGFNYSQIPGYINDEINRYYLYSNVNGISLNSNISDNIDFTLSYTENYSIVKNSIATSNIYGNNNPKFFYQTASTKFSWIFWKGIIFQSNVLWQFDKGFQNYNQRYVLWDMYLGKKLFKNQNGEIKLCIFDVLSQNENISHTATPQFLKDSKINTLNKFYMLTFTYDLNKLTNFGDSDKPKKEKKKGSRKK